MDYFNFIIDNFLYIVILFIMFFLYIKIKLFLNRYSERREFSKCESPIEEILFKEIRKSTNKKGQQYKVYTQVPCGNYRIDLAVYSGFRKIAIECDGKEFHTSKDQVKHDKKKDSYLRKHGWIIYRFTGSEIYRSPQLCVQAIKRKAK